MNKVVEILFACISVPIIAAYLLSEAYKKTASEAATTLVFVFAVYVIILTVWTILKFKQNGYPENILLKTIVFVDGVHFVHLTHDDSYATWVLLFICFILTAICLKKEFHHHFEGLEKAEQKKKILNCLSFFLIGFATGLGAEKFDEALLVKPPNHSSTFLKFPLDTSLKQS